MNEEALIKLMRAWDDMDNAAANILTALPHQMTERAAALNEQRLKMRDLVRGMMTATPVN